MFIRDNERRDARGHRNNQETRDIRGSFAEAIHDESGDRREDQAHEGKRTNDATGRKVRYAELEGELRQDRGKDAVPQGNGEASRYQGPNFER